MRTPELVPVLLPQHDSAHHRDCVHTGPEPSGIVHFTDGGESSLFVHELTMQHRPKRDATGRPLRLGPLVTNAYQAAKLLGPLLAPEAAEVFGVLCLTARCRVIGWCEICGGSVNRAGVAPRDVLRAALLSNAASVILAHNHPSGESHPSDDDCRLTKHVVEGATLLGIPILDHIIIGDHEYASVRAAPALAQQPSGRYGGWGDQAVRTSLWEDLIFTSGRWGLESCDDAGHSSLSTVRLPNGIG